jgi:sensor histidine kinase YesM
MLFVHILWYNVTISIICLIVCIATSRAEVTRNQKPNFWVSFWTTDYRKYTTTCAFDHSSLPNNVLVNHCDMLMLI